MYGGIRFAVFGDDSQVQKALTGVRGALRGEPSQPSGDSAFEGLQAPATSERSSEDLSAIDPPHLSEDPVAKVHALLKRGRAFYNLGNHHASVQESESARDILIAHNMDAPLIRYRCAVLLAQNELALGQPGKALHSLDTLLAECIGTRSLPDDLLARTQLLSADALLELAQEESTPEDRARLAHDAHNRVVDALGAITESDPLLLIDGYVLKARIESFCDVSGAALDSLEEALRLKPLIQKEDFGLLMRVQLLRACMLLESGHHEVGMKLFHELGREVEIAEAQAEFVGTLTVIRPEIGDFGIPEEVSVAIHAYRLLEAYQRNDRAGLLREFQALRGYGKSGGTSASAESFAPSAFEQSSPEAFLEYLSKVFRVTASSQDAATARQSANLAAVLRKTRATRTASTDLRS